jgi:hypothetical protein
MMSFADTPAFAISVMAFAASVALYCVSAPARIAASRSSPRAAPVSPVAAATPDMAFSNSMLLVMTPTRAPAAAARNSTAPRPARSKPRWDCLAVRSAVSPTPLVATAALVIPETYWPISACMTTETTRFVTQASPFYVGSPAMDARGETFEQQLLDQAQRQTKALESIDTYFQRLLAVLVLGALVAVVVLLVSR